MLATQLLQVNDLIDTSAQWELYRWVAEDESERHPRRHAILGFVWGLVGAAATVLMLVLIGE